MRKVIFAVLLTVIFSISSFAQVKAEESFSVKKRSIVIITVGGMQVALSNDDNGDCGTLYLINPQTNQTVGMSGIWDQYTLYIDEGEISMHCVFLAVGSKRNPKLESRPLIVKR